MKRAVPLLTLLAVAIGSATLAGGGAAARTAASRCRASALVVWLDTRGSGAAGSTYYRLELTNLSARACTLRGYPGVSAIDLAGRRLGSPASRNAAAAPRTVTLRPAGTASAVLRVADALNFDASSCRPVRAAGFRVYAPNATKAKIVPFPFLACSRRGASYLAVSSVRSA
jgi:hypothetical protein